MAIQQTYEDLAGRVAVVTGGAKGPSKSFIDSFTLAAAEQLEPFGVRVNAVLPGGRVNLRDAARPGGRPFDIMVPLTLYLASDASRHITGQILIAEEFNRQLT